MNISLTDWIKFKNTLSAISTKASDELVDWLQERGGYLNVDKDELISYAYALATKYGEASASLTAEMYDEIAELSGVIVPSAEVAETVSFSEIAKAINGVTKKTTTDSNVASVVGRYVKRTAEDTTLNNAERDGAQFAWVPSGDTCAFCITLASRGWQYMSKKARKNGHASHIHANCDCTYAIRFDDKTEIEGYDPQVYKDMYYGAEGNTPQERINSMRRDLYQENKDKINAQKRIAYEERNRKLNYGKSESFVKGTSVFSASPVNKYSENNIYVSDNLKLKNSEVRYVNKRISESKEMLGISEDCNIPVVIVEDNNSLASYNPHTNVLYVSSRMTNTQNVISLQEGYAASDNQNSTTVHELIHWSDAEEYRKTVGTIESADTKSDYSVYQREKAISELKKNGVDISDGESIKTISTYAFDNWLDNDFEEVYTEFRTKKILEG